MKRKTSFFVGLILLLCIINTPEVSSKASEGLSQAQKEQYYQEYLKIGEELREKYPDSLPFKVDEIEKIKDKDWVVSKEYRKKIIPIITKEKGIVDLPFVSFDVQAPSKYQQILSNDTVLANIVITSTVTVSYDSDLGQPVIEDISNVKSYTMTGFTHWGQVSSNFFNLNNNNNLTVLGNLSVGKALFPNIIEVSYSFNKYGFIQLSNLE